MTTTQVVETSVTVNNNIPIQDYIYPDNHPQPPYEMTSRFKPFPALKFSVSWNMHTLQYIIVKFESHQQALNFPIQ